MPWKSRPVILSSKQRDTLKAIVNDEQTSERKKQRAMIILLCAEGLRNKRIAQTLGIHENTVVKWRGRWTGNNKESSVDDHGSSVGRPAKICVTSTYETVATILRKEAPPNGNVRWSIRTLAKRMDLPPSTMYHVLARMQIQLDNDKSLHKL